MACGGRRSITAFEFDTVPTPAPVERLGFDVVGCFVDDGSDDGQNRVLSGENVKMHPKMTIQVFEDEEGENFCRRVLLARLELFFFLPDARIETMRRSSHPRSVVTSYALIWKSRQPLLRSA